MQNKCTCPNYSVPVNVFDHGSGPGLGSLKDLREKHHDITKICDYCKQIWSSTKGS